MATDLVPYVLLVAAILILAYIADALVSPEPLEPDPVPRQVQVIRVSVPDPWSYEGRHRPSEEFPASRLRIAEYVNRPYISQVATHEWPQITRRELVNAYQGGEQR